MRLIASPKGAGVGVGWRGGETGLVGRARWILCLVLVGLGLGASAAHAIVIMEPTVASRCGTGKTWDVVEACLKRTGKLQVHRTMEHAKLVSLEADGVYLYLEDARGWRIAGMYEGDHLTVLDVKPITVNKHRGYRIDLAQTIQTMFVRDDGRIALGLSRRRIAQFCGGEGYSCPTVTSLCEVFIGTRAVNVFRGTVTVGERTVTVTGDESRAGGACRSATTFELGWQPDP